jgi:hypothetical protein
MLMVKCPRVHLVHTLPEVPEYQERPQIEELREFWRNDTLRIAALIGIGGAGKTALVRRFLEELPGSTIVSPRVAKRADLPPPEGLFVWSFYSAPYVEEFFTEAFKLVRSCASANVTLPELEEPRRATVFMIEEALRKVPLRFLFVLDGLEKLQSEGSDGTEVGSLTDFPLKQFLTRIAEGCGNTKVLITSRYPLPDLRRYTEPFRDEVTARKHPPSFKSIENLDRLEPYKDPSSQRETDPAVGLLRALGVRGSDAKLEQIANEFDRHALTLELVGRWLKEFADGEAARANEIPLLYEATIALKGRGGEAARTASHMERILRAFRKRLQPEEMTLLECLSVLRAPVTIDVLLEISLGANKNVARPLPNWTHDLLASMLRHLCSLRLIYSERDAEGAERYAIHPLVREHFYRTLANASVIHEEIRKCLGRRAAIPDREAVSHRAWEDWLGNTFYPFKVNRQNLPVNNQALDTRTLDMLEEFLFHSLQSGKGEEALGFFQVCMLEHLFRNAGEYTRAERICRLFGTPDDPSMLRADLPGSARARFTNDRGLLLMRLGMLDKAAHCFACSIALRVSEGNWRAASSGFMNLCDCYLLLGRLRRAHDAAQKSLQLGGVGLGHLTYSYQARVLGLMGYPVSALQNFEFAKRQQNILEGDRDPLYSIRGVHHAMLLARLDLLDHSLLINTRNKEISLETDRRGDLARCDMAAAEIVLRLGDADGARQSLSAAQDWAVKTGDQEVLIWSYLVQAKLALRANNLDDARWAIHHGLRNACECGYGLYWIDLQIAKGQWQLACGRHLQKGEELPPELEIWTPQQWFEWAEASALRALNGQLKDNGEPASSADLPEEQLAMLGARHPECGYAWGEGDALHLLGEALLTLAQSVGPGGHDTKGRSYEELLRKAFEAAQETLSLRSRIQDPNANETGCLIKRIESLLKLRSTQRYKVNSMFLREVLREAELFSLMWAREVKERLITKTYATETVVQCYPRFSSQRYLTQFGIAKVDVPAILVPTEVPVRVGSLSNLWVIELTSTLALDIDMIIRIVLSQEPLNLTNDEDRAIVLPGSKTSSGVTIPYHQIISKRYAIGNYHGIRAIIGLLSPLNIAIVFATRISDVTATFSLLMNAPSFNFPELSVEGAFPDVGVEAGLFQDLKVKWCNAVFESCIASFRLSKD